MSRAAPSLLPRLTRLLETVGSNLKLARLRRKYSAEMVAQRASVSRKTVYRAELGDPAVALGIYARIMQALGLEQDLAALAADDLLGRKLQDAALPMQRRSSRKAAGPSVPDSGQTLAPTLPRPREKAHSE